MYLKVQNVVFYATNPDSMNNVVKSVHDYNAKLRVVPMVIVIKKSAMSLVLVHLHFVKVHMHQYVWYCYLQFLDEHKYVMFHI